MLHALAHGVDGRVVGLQAVVDENAAVAGEIRPLGELDVGPHAHRHDHEIRGDLLATVEPHAGDALAAQDGLRLGAHAELDAALLQRRLEQRAGRRVELPLHERVEQVHHGDVHAAQGEPVRGLQA